MWTFSAQAVFLFSVFHYLHLVERQICAHDDVEACRLLGWRYDECSVVCLRGFNNRKP